LNSFYQLHFNALQIAPDLWEPNDTEHTPAQLPPGDQQLSQLTLHTPFDRDLYRWKPTARGAATIDLLFAHAEGDLDLILWQDGEEIAYATSNDDNERIELDADLQRDYLIEVRAKGAATSGGYQLLLDGASPPQVAALRTRRSSDPAATWELAVPGDLPRIIPWSGLNQIEIVFTKDMVVLLDSLTVVGAGGRNYFATELHYDPITYTALWSFAEGLGRDQLTLQLADRLTDVQRNALDGEFNPTGGLPSGDGTAGGEFRLNFRTLPGDFSGDGRLDVADIDALAAGLRDNSPYHDLNADGWRDERDILMLVQQLIGATIGDSNLDREFDSADLIQIFQAGEFEDAMRANSTWAEGDWTGDGEFDSADLVFAFQVGDYRG
jgi:hypothetical protein